MLITDLPDDILLSICTLILCDPQDIFSLKQTCRLLHAIVDTSDYLWHHLSLDLPLSTRPGTQISHLQAREVQSIVLRALRLDKNWRRPVSQIQSLRVAKLKAPDIPMQLQLLPSATPAWDWLVVLAPKSPDRALSVYSFGKTLTRHFVSVPIQKSLAFSACTIRDESELLVATISQADKQEHLQVHRVYLNEFDIGESELLVDIMRRTSDGRFFGVQIHQNIVAVGISRPENDTCSVLLVNLTTGTRAIASTFGVGSRFYFEVLSSSIRILVHTPSNGLRSETLPLPPTFLVSPIMTDTSLKRAAKPATDPIPSLQLSSSSSSSSSLQTSTDLAISELFLPSSPHSSLSDEHCPTPFMSFQPTAVHGIVRSPAATNESARLPLRKFDSLTTTNWASAELVSLGRGGRRAVWLQQSTELDRQQYTLLKMSFDWSDSDGTKPTPLLSPSVVLPFGLETCRSLFFDEARGTVLLGLYTGEVYGLDF